MSHHLSAFSYHLYRRFLEKFSALHFRFSLAILLFLRSKQHMSRRCVIFGFGAVAQTTFKLIAKHLPISEYLLIDGRQLSEKELEITKGYKVTTVVRTFNNDTLEEGAFELIKDDDMVFDFFGCADSLQIIRACTRHKNVLYLNACLEEWEELELPSGYQLYERMYNFRKTCPNKATACIDAGANPGIITHFAILATFHMAQSAIDRKVHDADKIKELLDKKDVAGLATQLQVDALHISEIETIEPADEKLFEGATCNSWCVPSFHDEWMKASEVSIGTSDREDLTKEGYSPVPESVPQSTLIPFPLHLKTACPNFTFTGRCVRHPETLEISKVFHDTKTGHVPTVAFVYHPSRLPLQSMRQPNWKTLPKLIMSENYGGPLDGAETMGATLISAREDIPPRWYGSILSCQQARDVECIMNPTTLQVAASALAHMAVALKHPEQGICMPHDFDSEEIMEIAKPYLGTVWDGDLEVRLPSRWRDLIVDEVL
ncbi:hypothetical protein TRFO_28405 [Tritrichomonas foetus]|uniref:Saccharopine dehydrogenase NADP binding domain-containing protein n=1 Tax=Tritrichomonas foetus TaxID=1144522 RepID=A0A1J4K0B9_9EUKA|nr:hypothetical protein TRFO_28405 [Tritrichomonas foetus]|eukprot:OHT04176.1 hypothetical protein TRFO_28405 [Tritrichomonas foetus]